MNLYRVGIRELHIRYVNVQAESEAEAKDLADHAACLGVTGDLQYIDDYNKSEWDVEEMENDTA